MITPFSFLFPAQLLSGLTDSYDQALQRDDVKAIVVTDISITGLVILLGIGDDEI